ARSPPPRRCSSAGWPARASSISPRGSPCSLASSASSTPGRAGGGGAGGPPSPPTRPSLRHAWLSEAYLHAGRITEARVAAERALALARAHKEQGNEGWGLGMFGEGAAG